MKLMKQQKRLSPQKLAMGGSGVNLPEWTYDVRVRAAGYPLFGVLR